MKRLVVFVALMLSCSFLVPLSASARFGDSARGRGEDVNFARFSFTAEGFGGGSFDTGAFGTWKHTSSREVFGSSSTFEGDVRCLIVAGNTATFAGVLTKAPNRFQEGSGFVVTVEDNNGTGADRYGLFFAGFGPVSCLTPAITAPITKGDIEVVGSTFPT